MDESAEISNRGSPRSCFKPDSTINIGVVTDDYAFLAGEESHLHSRKVDWKKIGLSRTVFTQPALYELGAFLTAFRTHKHTQELLAELSTQA